MPLKEFREKYGGNIASVLLGDANSRLAESIAAAAPATGLRTRNGPVTAIAGTQVLISPWLVSDRSSKAIPGLLAGFPGAV